MFFPVLFQSQTSTNTPLLSRLSFPSPTIPPLTPPCQAAKVQDHRICYTSFNRTKKQPRNRLVERNIILPRLFFLITGKEKQNRNHKSTRFFDNSL